MSRPSSRSVFSHDAHAARRGAVEHRAIGVLAVGKVSQRLRVDRLVRDDPENEAGVRLEILPENARKGLRCEKRLAAARRHLEHHVGDGPADTVMARRIGDGGARRRKRARLASFVHALRGEIGNVDREAGIRPREPRDRV